MKLSATLNDSDDFAVNIKTQGQYFPDTDQTISIDKPIYQQCKTYPCHLCKKDLFHMTEARRAQHINNCLNKAESKTKIEVKKQIWENTFDCPLCKKALEPGPFRTSHLKLCARQNDLGGAAALVQMVETQSKIAQARKERGLFHTSAPKPSKESVAPRKRKKDALIPAGVQDEEVHMAKALSLSTVSGNCLSEGPITSAINAESAEKSEPVVQLCRSMPSVLEHLQERLFTLITPSSPVISEKPCLKASGSPKTTVNAWWPTDVDLLTSTPFCMEDFTNDLNLPSTSGMKGSLSQSSTFGDSAHRSVVENDGAHQKSCEKRSRSSSSPILFEFSDVEENSDGPMCSPLNSAESISADTMAKPRQDTDNVTALYLSNVSVLADCLTLSASTSEQQKDKVQNFEVGQSSNFEQNRLFCSEEHLRSIVSDIPRNSATVAGGFVTDKSKHPETEVNVQGLLQDNVSCMGIVRTDQSGGSVIELDLTSSSDVVILDNEGIVFDSSNRNQNCDTSFQNWANDVDDYQYQAIYMDDATFETPVGKTIPVSNDDDKTETCANSDLLKPSEWSADHWPADDISFNLTSTPTQPHFGSQPGNVVPRDIESVGYDAGCSKGAGSPLTRSTSTPMDFASHSGCVVVKRHDVTPYPNYSLMPTPKLKDELTKYGIRKKISKKRALPILKAAYHTTHPVVSVGGDFSGSAPGNGGNGSSSAGVLEESYRDSQESCSPLKDADTERKFRRFISERKELYTKILLYQPVAFEDIQELAFNNKIKISKNKLIDFLDREGVTWQFQSKPIRRQRGKYQKSKSRLIL